MKYRKLGNTGLSVSEIGYGTWGLGGNAYGVVDDSESKQALTLALERGVNFFDTADLYGNGHSEELLGEVFRGVRNEIIIATKGGTLPHSGFDMPQDFSVAYLKRALEESLKRLDTAYVDLYQLHSPKIEAIENNEEIIHMLKGFQKEGKIRSFGISVRSPEDGKIAIQKYGFPVVQVNFNMIDQRAIENGLFDLAKNKKVGLIIRTPLVFGYLAGKLRGDEQFEGIDHRANWPKEQLQRWACAPKLFSFLWEGSDRTPAQVALRFCLEYDVVSTVIPGMMTVREVTENIRATHIPPLTQAEMKQIREIYQSHEFYDKTIKHTSDEKK